MFVLKQIKNFFLIFVFILGGCDLGPSKLFDSTFSFREGLLYENGLLFSGVIEFNDSKQEQVISTYKNGFKHGKEMVFLENGQQIGLFFYKNGQCFGIQKEWWPNGTKRKVYRCDKQAQKHDLYETWYQNGEQEYALMYHHGYPEGDQQSWYDNGFVRFNYIMKNGRRYGVIGTKTCKPGQFRINN